MEHHLEYVCLDFYGLPGSGKSTLSHLLAQKLSENIEVCEPSFSMDHGFSFKQRLFKKICGLVKTLLRHPLTFFKVVKIVRGFGFCFFKSDFYIHLLNICYKVYALKNIRTHFLVFDQGLLQSAMSLFYRRENKSDFEKIYHQLTNLANPSIHYLNIYVQADIKTVMKRMKYRQTNISRVQLLSEQEQIKELNDQLSLLKMISPTIVVNSNEMGIEECVSVIRSKLGVK